MWSQVLICIIFVDGWRVMTLFVKLYILYSLHRIITQRTFESTSCSVGRVTLFVSNKTPIPRRLEVAIFALEVTILFVNKHPFAIVGSPFTLRTYVTYEFKVTFFMEIQIILKNRFEIAHFALQHRHWMVTYVLGNHISLRRCVIANVAIINFPRSVGRTKQLFQFIVWNRTTLHTLRSSQGLIRHLLTGGLINKSRWRTVGQWLFLQQKMLKRS